MCIIICGENNSNDIQMLSIPVGSSMCFEIIEGDGKQSKYFCQFWSNKKIFLEPRIATLFECAQKRWHSGWRQRQQVDALWIKASE